MYQVLGLGLVYGDNGVWRVRLPVCIIVAYLQVSAHATFNRQATVGVASSVKADEYDVESCGVFTDDNIERKVKALQEKYEELEVVERYA